MQRLQEMQELTIQILEDLNKVTHTQDAISKIVSRIKTFIGCDAIGLRLKDMHGFPFFYSDGFGDTQQKCCTPFFKPKASLNHSEEKQTYECLCGFISSQKIGTKHHILTEAGSFWTNHFLELCQKLPELIPGIRTRGFCSEQGFESSAYIPIRINNQLVGILLIHDTKKNFFSSDMISFFERIAQSIGIAYIRTETEIALREAKQAMELKNQLLCDALRNEKKLVSELEYSRKKADEAHTMKSEFLATMSHEIKTPLNGIIGFSSLLKATQLNENQMNYLNNILFSSDCLLSVIDTILDLSKIESGSLELESIPFDLWDLIEKIAALVGPSVQKKNLFLSTKVHPSVPRICLGDPTRLRQILLNLTNNAIKFSHQGTIIISIEHIRSTDTVTTLLFQVSDQGIGISTKNQQKLFVPFSQIDSTTTRQYGGTGLGLAISKKIVESLGGSIGVTSEEGKGSCFFFQIDLHISHNQTQPSSSVSPAVFPIGDITLSSNSVHHTNHTILVAEDSHSNQILMKHLLKNIGFVCEIAENGEHAVESAIQGNHSLIIMDCHMPIMDGFEATKLIRKKGITIPIIALTAESLISTQDKCLESGMNDYLVKPIDPPLLLAMINKWLVVEKKATIL